MRPARRSWWSCREAIRSRIRWTAVRTIGTDRLRKKRLRVSNRKHSQQDSVDQAEDRGIGANPERERQNRDGGKPAIAPEHAERLTQVGAEIVEMMEPPAPAALLFRTVDAAEFGPRPALRHSRGTPCRARDHRHTRPDGSAAPPPSPVSNRRRLNSFMASRAGRRECPRPGRKSGSTPSSRP